MKKIVTMLIVCFMVIFVQPTQAQTYENDMRAVWISTVYNLDYPSTKNNVTAQQNEFIDKLEKIKAMGMNTVIVQVRPKADALYASSINPWSDVLTGQQGKYPGYDPLTFMVQAAHERGIDIHAWLNPYRITTTGTDLNVLCATHPARLNPSWTFTYNNALFYNPEVEEVKQHIVETVKEIAINYNVDGIHFDDYFYPSNYPLPQGETKDGVVANNRREAVNDMVKRVSRTIKTVNATYGKAIKFGISPPGIWKNNTSDISGSSTAGRESYYALFADTRTWIKNEWIDYVVPQIYWKIGHSKADYETLVKWWNNEVTGTNVKLYIGQGIYTDDVAKEITKQLQLNKTFSNIKGSVFFSLRDLLNDRQGCKTQITSIYGGNNSFLTPGIGNTTNSNSSNTTIDNSLNGAVNNNGTNSSLNNNTTTNNGNTNISNNNQNSNTNTTTPNTSTNNTINSSNGFDDSDLWVDDSINQIGDETSPGQSVDKLTNSNTSDLTSHIGKTGKVNATSLNIRAGANTERAVVAKVPSGTKVTILSVLNGWYKVKLSDGKVGWANSSYISVSEETSSTTIPTQSSSTQSSNYPFTGTVTATTLNVRSGARVDRELIATLTKGSSVSVLSAIGDWYKVKLSNGKVGWANSQYISKGKEEAEKVESSSLPKKGKVIADSLNVRSGAKTDREVITTVSKGTELTILSCLGEWYKVKLSDGKVGWVVKSYIS